MQLGKYKFDRTEFAGSLGDLGTLIPLSLALIVINGLSVTTILLFIGLFYICSGLYFKLPIPVQPLKVVAAVAVAYPEKISINIIGATGIIFGIVLLFLAYSGLINQIAKLFSKPIVRGIQLGLGFILLSKGINFILKPELFIQHQTSVISIYGIHLNLIIGIFGFFIALLLLSNKRFPAAIVLITFGILIGVFSGAMQGTSIVFGPSDINIIKPDVNDFINAFLLLVLPQIPLTIGNAIIGTKDACISFFGNGKESEKATNKSFSLSMGFINIIAGFFCGMPMCHGAGGLAAHYRFGARTGGSNLMIGIIFVILAFFFGKIGISILSAIPNSVLGVLLIFAGLELALLIKDVEEKNDLFIAFLIAGVGYVTTNMGIAFFTGFIVMRLVRMRNIKL